MTDWLYDPGWRAFVRWENGIQQFQYEEQLEAAAPSWGERIGLDRETRERLKADPAPGVYNGTSRPIGPGDD